MNKGRLVTAERVLKALGNRRRLSIVHLLRKRGRVSVGDIAGHIVLSFPATSRHLRILANANVVGSEQVNTTVNYFLATEHKQILDPVLLALKQ